jgi:hypothetical protein
MSRGHNSEPKLISRVTTNTTTSTQVITWVRTLKPAGLKFITDFSPFGFSSLPRGRVAANGLGPASAGLALFFLSLCVHCSLCSAAVMKTIIAVVISAIGLIGTIGKSVAESNAPESHALSVRIEANDDELSNLVNSYISRELRSLKDVTINTAPQPTLVIHCACIPAMVGGRNVGCVVSFVITSNVKPVEYIAENKNFTDVLDNSPEAKVHLTKMFLTQICRLTQQYEDQSLFTCPTASLRENCESFVATFDTKYLNPLRAKQTAAH